MRLIVCAATLCLTLPLAAHDLVDPEGDMLVSMSYCIPGEICLSCDSEMPRPQVNALLGENLAIGEVLLFTPDPNNPTAREWLWTATGINFPTVVEERLVGTKSLEAEPACSARAALPGSVQPRDGLWKVTHEAPEFENCSMRTPAAMPSTTDAVVFEKPFRGRTTTEEPIETVIQVAPNLFASRQVMGELIGQGLVEVHSPTRLVYHYNVTDPRGGEACLRRYTSHITYEGEAPE